MRRARRRFSASQLEQNYMFSSLFEEKKTLEYFINLVNSKFLNHKALSLFKFARAIIGDAAVMSIIQKEHPNLFKDDNRNSYTLAECEDEIPHSVLCVLIKKEILPIIDKRLKKIGSQRTLTERRLSVLSKTFGLNKVEEDVVCFFYLIETSGLLDEYLSSSSFFEAKVIVKFKSNGHLIIGIEKKDFLKIFSSKTLFNSEVLEANNSIINISHWSVEYLSGVGSENLSNSFFTTVNDEILDVTDFEITDDERVVLDDLLNSKQGRNMLFYGAPGTGKTALARAIAKHYGKTLFTVKVFETDRIEIRMRPLYAAVNLADSAKSIILIDEADEMLNTFDSIFHRSRTNKSWINNFLESHNQKIIWITNRSSQIDPSTMRRFSFSIEFKHFNYNKRMKVLNYAIEQQGLKGYFTDNELGDLCKNFSVNADGIVNAIKLFKINRKTKKEAALKKIQTMLRNNEKVTGRKKTSECTRNFASYSLNALNCSENMETVVSSVILSGLKAGASLSLGIIWFTSVVPVYIFARYPR